MCHLQVIKHGSDRRTRVGLDAVMFAESFVEVQLLAVDTDLHAAVVKGRHRGGRQRDVF